MSDPLIIEIQIDSRSAEPGRDAVIRSLADIKASVEASGRTFGGMGKSGADAFEQIRASAEKQMSVMAGNRREYDLLQSSLRGVSKDRLDYIRNIYAETDAQKSAIAAQQSAAAQKEISMKRDIEMQKQRWAVETAMQQAAAAQREISQKRDTEMQNQRWAVETAMQQAAGAQREISQKRDMEMQNQRWANDKAAATAASANAAAMAASEKAAESGVSSFRRMSKAVASLSYELFGAVTGLTILGGVLGSPAIAGVSFLKNIEDTQVGMAGILGSIGRINGAMPTYQQSLAAAQGVTAQLAKDSIKYGLSLEDLTNAARVALAPGLQAGVEINDIVKIATISTIAVKSFALDSRQVIQETRALLTGSGNPASATLRTALGLTTKDIEAAKASSEGLFAFLTEKMQGFNNAAVERQNTLSGSFDLLKIKIVRLFADTGIFDALKSAVKGVSEAIASIDKKTNQFIFTPEAVQTAQTYLEVLKFVGGAITEAVKMIYEFRKAIGLASEMMLAFIAGRFVLTRLVAGVVYLTEAAAALAVGMGALPALMGTFGTATATAMTTATVATETFGMRAIRIAGGARGGLIGLALFGLYELLDYTGVIDAVFKKSGDSLEVLSKQVDEAIRSAKDAAAVQSGGVNAPLVQKFQTIIEQKRAEISALDEEFGKLKPSDSIADESGYSIAGSIALARKAAIEEMSKAQAELNRLLGDAAVKRQEENNQLGEMVKKQEEVRKQYDSAAKIVAGIVEANKKKGGGFSGRFEQGSVEDQAFRDYDRLTTTLDEITKKIEAFKRASTITGNTLPADIAALQKGAEGSDKQREIEYESKLNELARVRVSIYEQTNAIINNPKSSETERATAQAQQSAAFQDYADAVGKLRKEYEKLSPAEAFRLKSTQSLTAATAELAERQAELARGDDGKLNQFEKELIRINIARETLRKGGSLVGEYKDADIQALDDRAAGLARLAAGENALKASVDANKRAIDEEREALAESSRGADKASSLMDEITRSKEESLRKIEALKNNGVSKSSVANLDSYFGSETAAAQSEKFKAAIEARKDALYKEAAAADAARLSHKRLEDQLHNEKIVKEFNSRTNIDIQALQDEYELQGATGKERARIMATKAMRRRTQAAIDDLRPESGVSVSDSPTGAGISDKAITNVKAFAYAMDEANTSALEVVDSLKSIEAIDSNGPLVSKGAVEGARAFAYEMNNASENPGLITEEMANTIDAIEAASTAMNSIAIGKDATDGVTAFAYSFDQAGKSALELARAVEGITLSEEAVDGVTAFAYSFDEAGQAALTLSDGIDGVDSGIGDLQSTSVDWIKELEKGNDALAETGRLIDAASESSWSQVRAQQAITKAAGATAVAIGKPAPDGPMTERQFKKSRNSKEELLRTEAEWLAHINKLESYNASWEAGVNRAANNYIEQMGGASEAVEKSMSNGLKSFEDNLVNLFVDGKFAAKEFFHQIFADVTRLIIQQQFIKPIAEILGAGAKASTSGGGIDWLGMVGSLFGSGSGGGVNTAGDSGGFELRARGGAVSAGAEYLVGELGPEKFVPQSNGYIVPNNILEAPKSQTTVVQSTPINITNNIDARGADAGVQARIDMAMEKSSAKTFEMVRQSLVRGGAMSKALR